MLYQLVEIILIYLMMLTPKNRQIKTIGMNAITTRHILYLFQGVISYEGF